MPSIFVVSVLVNGSTTEEFQFYKGLKQGDPLSPFLFILVMESLHLSFKRVEDAGMFNGIKINSSMTLSHMFYADDAIFMGQWSKRNVDTLMYMLKCFERALGLSINLSKSKLMGLAVSIEKVEEVTRHIGCGILNTPFSFLGSKVGDVSSTTYGIYPVSLFLCNDLDSKRSIWVSWNKVLTSKEKGGLGVSSLFVLNRALMIDRAGNVGYTSIWCDIIKEMDRLASHGIDLISNKLISVKFQFEQTSLASSLRRMPPSGIEFEQWDHLLDSLEGVMLSPSEDRWSWDLNGSGEFSVASAQKVPIKVNVHAWKVRINGLPTRWNISRRGIDIPSILCPLCETCVESSKHLFFNCSVVRDIFRRICIWWDMSYMELDSFDE
ncbi:RNA-directed DNA polymerase, eukaryota, reverse transcriptase zinc-binding domain protein [Tanacetum coccineum]|uniref:RNA-directed DNA polymerase, eukaryota, reverse transcriptase zinc-binding domain protein n=1 Tax=Tanacetum coccineum TaxID=301880 RepID=A0ABQ5GUL4_9ASTR